MMPPIEIIASRLHRRSSGTVFLTDDDIGAIIDDFLRCNDAMMLYDLIEELTCIAAFFSSGDGREVGKAIMSHVVPAISRRAANLAAVTRGGANQRSAAPPKERSHSVRGALQAPEPTRITHTRRNPY